jgi:uncharacterized membrane protein YfcA
MKLILLPLAIGLFAGVMAGLCGVGGGIVLVPAFAYLLGMEQQAAIATIMAVIVPTSLIAIARFQQSGLVQWQIFWPTALGAIFAAYFATGWVRKLSNDQLTKVFAVLMILVGISMLFKKS